MIGPGRSLDCSPLTPSAEASVSDADLRRIQPLQRALLTPLDYATIDGWRRAVNRALVAAFGSDAAMFQLDLDGVPLQFSDEFETAHLEKYSNDIMATLSRERRLYTRMLEIGAGNRSMLWAADLEWLYRSEYFNELVVPMQAYDPLWAAAPMGPDAYPAALHTYHDRRRSDLFFDASDVTLMRVLQPALEAGVRVVQRAEAGRASLPATLDGIGDAVLVYDLQGGLLHTSGRLAGLARTRRAEERIVAEGREMARGLAAAGVVDPLDPRNATRTVTTRAGDCRLNAVRLGEGVFTLRPAVLVTVSAGEPPLPGRDALRERFGLTKRQAEVALLLAGRKANAEIAEELFISEHTVRSHVEAVMGTLGVHDRREIRATITAA